MTSRIAILGWGSLLWDHRAEFEQWHGPWQLDGPTLKLEFSRRSSTRDDALTLVIDDKNGSECAVAYCLSKRRSLNDAIADLRCREGTPIANIGFIDPTNNRSPHGRDSKAIAAITKWTAQNSLAAVVWTDLESNFANFSVPAAIRHIQNLDALGKAKAAEYIWRAPDFVRTPLRTALEATPWFPPN